MALNFFLQDIEFDQLHNLNVQASNVVSSASQASSTGNLGNQLLPGPHREPGAAAMITMPQVCFWPVSFYIVICYK